MKLKLEMLCYKQKSEHNKYAYHHWHYAWQKTLGIQLFRLFGGESLANDLIGIKDSGENFGDLAMFYPANIFHYTV